MNNLLNFLGEYEVFVGKRISKKTGNEYNALFIRKGKYCKMIGIFDDANLEIFNKIPVYDESIQVHYIK